MYPLTFPEPELKREIPAYFNACSFIQTDAEALFPWSTDFDTTFPALLTVILMTTVPEEL